jgi:hypothetical protein
MGDSGKGLPWGVRWISSSLGFLLDFNNMIVVNRVMLVGMTVEASELIVNESGVRENRFRNEMRMNRLIIIWLNGLFFLIGLSSFFMKFLIIVINISLLLSWLDGKYRMRNSIK